MVLTFFTTQFNPNIIKAIPYNEMREGKVIFFSNPKELVSERGNAFCFQDNHDYLWIHYVAF